VRVGAGLARTVFYVLSPQVAEPLAAIASGGVRVAARPDEASLLALLDPALAHPG
jgi:hypothetical protein